MCVTSSPRSAPSAALAEGPAGSSVGSPVQAAIAPNSRADTITHLHPSTERAFISRLLFPSPAMGLVRLGPDGWLRGTGKARATRAYLGGRRSLLDAQTHPLR